MRLSYLLPLPSSRERHSSTFSLFRCQVQSTAQGNLGSSVHLRWKSGPRYAAMAASSMNPPRMALSRHCRKVHLDSFQLRK